MNRQMSSNIAMSFMNFSNRKKALSSESSFFPFFHFTRNWNFNAQNVVILFPISRHQHRNLQFLLTHTALCHTVHSLNRYVVLPSSYKSVFPHVHVLKTGQESAHPGFEFQASYTTYSSIKTLKLSHGRFLQTQIFLDLASVRKSRRKIFRNSFIFLQPLTRKTIRKFICTTINCLLTSCQKAHLCPQYSLFPSPFTPASSYRIRFVHSRTYRFTFSIAPKVLALAGSYNCSVSLELCCSYFWNIEMDMHPTLQATNTFWPLLPVVLEKKLWTTPVRASVVFT